MKVLVQDLLTLSYYRAPDNWTTDPNGASGFQDSHAAMRFCLEHDLPHAQVVLKFPDEQYDVLLPVTDLPQADSSMAEAAV